MDDEIASVASKEYNPYQIKLRDAVDNSPSLRGSPSIRSINNQGSALKRHNSNISPEPEITTVSQMIGARNQIYCEPFDVFDPNHPLRGKKRFNDNFRPLRSKINLKITAEEAQKRKRSNKVTVE